MIAGYATRRRGPDVVVPGLFLRQHDLHVRLDAAPLDRLFLEQDSGALQGVSNSTSLAQHPWRLRPKAPHAYVVTKTHAL